MVDRSLFLAPARERRQTDRRRKRRAAIELRGELRMGGEARPVLIGDLPGSGAVVFTDHPPSVGDEVELWIEDFGTIAVEIVHSSTRLCGLVVSNPAAHRDELLRWLRRKLKMKPTKQNNDRRAPVLLCAGSAQMPSSPMR